MVKVLIQWATSTALDWKTYEVTRIQEVRGLPRKPRPGNGPQVIDGTEGWIAAINIQGIVYSGYDVIGFSIVAPDILRVHCLNDGSDFAVGEHYGCVWDLRPPAPDPALGGLTNTRQSVTWYGEANSAPVLRGLPNVQPYASMPMPTNANDKLYGVWVPDAQWAALLDARTSHGWREWAT